MAENKYFGAVWEAYKARIMAAQQAELEQYEAEKAAEQAKEEADLALQSRSDAVYQAFNFRQRWDRWQKLKREQRKRREQEQQPQETEPASQ